MHFLLYEPITLLEFSILSACLSPFVKKIGIWLSHSRSCFKNSFLLNAHPWYCIITFNSLSAGPEDAFLRPIVSWYGAWVYFNIRPKLCRPHITNQQQLHKYVAEIYVIFFGIGNEWICYKSFEMGWSCAITELSETLYWIPSKEYIRSLKVIGDPANYKSHPYWWQNT